MTGQGLFVTFEGGEGTGKSTLLQAVADRLGSQGLPVETAREPGGTVIGEKIREILLSEDLPPLEPAAELFLFLASRVQIIKERLVPILAQGRIVLCDRFEEATFAYQIYGRNLPENEVLAACNLATGGLKADLVILLDLPPEEGLERVKKRTDDLGLRRLEEEPLPFHRRVREGYLFLAQKEPDRFLVLDGRQSPETLAKKATDAILKLLRTKK